MDNQVKLSEEAARIKEREIAMKKFSAEIEAKSMQIKQLKSMIKNLEEVGIRFHFFPLNYNPYFAFSFHKVYSTCFKQI